MAKTKTTPRAKASATPHSQTASIPAPRPICPVCKEFIGGQKGDFEKHLIECYKGRPQCLICGQTFKLRSYLHKHEQSVHKLNLGKPAETSVVPSYSTSELAEGKTKKSVEKDDSEDNYSDWNNSPDVSLRDSESEKEDEKVDSCGRAKDESFPLGRVIRKSTTPAKPTCPKRQKTEEKPEADSDERKVMIKEVKKDKKGLGDLKEIKVACALVNKEASSETVTKVTENGDEIYADKVTRKKQKLGHINIDIGNIVPEGSVCTNDIHLKINGEGSVELRLNYHPKSDD